ncbi:MAG: hypothetical protein H7061_03370 [Bdellovibrionaceae bacterium]|nr:hypothetical protein [Bdellovibrio sp.]
MNFILGLIALYSATAVAAEMTCQIKLNLEPQLSATVVTHVNKKTAIGATKGIYAYVTEKENNYFIVEAFLADYEARIYGEGFLKQTSDRLTASIWSRENQIELTCLKK